MVFCENSTTVVERIQTQLLFSHSAPGAGLANGGLPATVGDLPSFDFQVDPHEITQDVIAELERHPELPGVLIVDRKNYVGAVSRKKCLEALSRPYGTEVFLTRSIIVLYNQLNIWFVPLDASTRIDLAVQLALNRPANQRYEPLVLKSDGRARMLDLHVLLLAQSHLLANANSLVRQQIEIGRALSSTLELDAVLDLILKHMAEIVPYERAGVMLQEGNALKFVATRGFPPDMRPEQLRVSIKESDLYQQIYQSKQPLSIPDVAHWPDWQYVPGLPKARSWMGAPLVHSNEVIGMLSLTRTVADDYSEDELTLAQTFAGQAAMALQNARLYGEIKRFSQDLESMVRARTEELQIAYEKLERLDRSKSDFIGVASHELRTPLTVVSGYAQMLLQDAGIEANSAYLQLASGIQAGIKRMHEVVNSMLDVTKIDQRVLQLSREPVHLPDLLQELIGELTLCAAERRIALTLEDIGALPIIQGDSRALYKVFYNLLINAIKFTPDGGRIVVSGRLEKEAVEISVCDSGIGIDPEYHELIFEKFYQTGQVSLHSSGKTKFKGGGPGLGLAIARGIVQAHGGRIWVSSPKHDQEALPGSVFYVLLPLARDERSFL